MKINTVKSYKPQTIKYRNIKNNISFKKNMDELIYPFGHDLVQYSVATNSISIQGVQGIVRKYSPKTKVDSIENYKEYDTRKPLALLNSSYNFLVDDDGKAHIYPSSKTVYIGIDKAKDETLGAFLAQVIHEATHLFQQESDDRVNYEFLYKQYLNNAQDKNALKNTIDIIDKIFINLETYMAAGYTMCTDKGLKTDNDVNKGFEKKFGYGIYDMLQYIILSTISDNGDRKVNFNFIFDYCIMRSKNEIEAYQNMLSFRPKLLDDKSQKQIELMVMMYSKIASELELMKKKYNTP